MATSTFEHLPLDLPPQTTEYCSNFRSTCSPERAGSWRVGWSAHAMMTRRIRVLRLLPYATWPRFDSTPCCVSRDDNKYDVTQYYPIGDE